MRHPPIDLRSDTVTRPTPAMRQAMAQAEVGDDVMGEDPTVRRLQDLAARMLGKQAALFVPSGTMGNLVALLVHTKRQGEAIVEREAHLYLSEAGAAAALAGVQCWPLEGKAGVLAPEQVEAAIRGDDPHHPRTTLVALENTHNRHGGAPLPRDAVKAVAEVAHARHIPLHVDGARLFNAATALGVPASELVRDADSVMVCLSKGLCAPVGSIVAGDRAFIAEAVLARKLLGRGEDAGLAHAAAGILALEQHVPLLGQDHAKAALLAEAVQQAAPHGLRMCHPQATNIVMFEAPQPDRFQAAMAKEGVLLDQWHDGKLRMVTHHDVSPEQAIAAAAALFRVARG
jgi:threonine aldolase